MLANSLHHERRERARDRRLRLVSRVRLSELSLPVKKNVSNVLFLNIQYLAYCEDLLPVPVYVSE